MSLLPNYKKGYEYEYLTKDLIETIRTTVHSHSTQFILKDRRIRLPWIKLDVGLLIYIHPKYGLLKSSTYKFCNEIIFGLYREKILDTLDDYRKHGELVFCKKNEALFEAALKKRNPWFYLNIGGRFVKWRFKKMHNQEEERRNGSFLENPLYYIENPISIEESVLINYESLKLFSGSDFLYLSNWEYQQTEILIKRIDRTFQRFIPCEEICKKEIIGRLHIKMDELSKEIDAKEKSGKSSKEEEIAFFQTKIELAFYNHLNKNIDKLQKSTNGSKRDDSAYIRRHNLIMFYLLKYGKVIREDVSNSRYATLIQYLTGKSHHNIRKNWPDNLYRKSDKNRREDLAIIWELFNNIKADGIKQMIENDIAYANKFKVRNLNGKGNNRKYPSI